MAIRIRLTRIKAIIMRATGTSLTWIRAHLPRALMATTPITLTAAHPMVTTDLAGFRTNSLLVSGRGVGAGATSTVAVGTTVGVVTMVDAATTADVPTAEAEMPWVAAVVVSVEVAVP